MVQSTTERKPLYAAAGVADAAVSALRELAANAPAEVQKLRAELPGLLHEAPARVRTYAAELADDLGETYTALAVRGEQAVGRFRNEYAGAVGALGGKVAEVAEKTADTADRVADEIAEEAAATAPTAPATKAAAGKSTKGAKSTTRRPTTS